MINYLRFRLIDLLRGTRSFRLYRELSVSQFKSQAEVASENNFRKIALLKLAAANAAVFQGMDSTDLVSWPKMDKDTVRSDPQGFINKNYRGRRFLKKTSGSTGAPFQFESSELAQSYLWACIYLAWSAAGYRLGQPVAFLAGAALFSNTWKHKLFYRLMNVYPLSAMGMNDDAIKDHCEKLVRKKIKVLYGYSTALHTMAQYVLQNPKAVNDHSLIAVMSTSENLSMIAKRDIQNAFGVRVFNQYGCNDAGISAFECEAGEGLHIVWDRCFAEIDADGHLRGTDFANVASFFIRYDTGDLATLSHEPCKCGRAWPRITEFSGRANDLVIDLAGKKFPGAYFSNLFIGSGVKGFQVHFDECRIKILFDNQGQPFEATRLLDRLKRDMSFEHYSIVEAPFVVQANGKRRYVIKMEAVE
ncbi:hypothetical protein [Chitinolyticbacter albus]|uniref:hypothetical protein n=1 Tax=Chitinolyticbacter albus TaxID=2961951 RepID=UPI0021088F2A|nr:hypothetical protein [Chitinolyticbacter albus]